MDAFETSPGLYKFYWGYFDGTLTIVKFNTMLAIELTLSVFVLAGIIVVSFTAGFIIRRKQIRSYRKKIFELEKEMLVNHADILELQKHKALLEQNLQSSKIPVIPLNPEKQENADKHSDKARRK